MISLFLVDDDSNILHSLTDFENNESEISVVGSSVSGIETSRQLKLTDVDIVLFNIINPEMAGVACCKQLKEQFPKVKVIAFIGELDSDTLLKIWLQKVDAILLRSTRRNELITVIRRVMKGRKIVGDNIKPFFENGRYGSGDIPFLTKTEIKVLTMLGSGLSRKEVAHKMNRTLYSVQFHCKNIFQKFNAHKMKPILDKVRDAKIIK